MKFTVRKCSGLPCSLSCKAWNKSPCQGAVKTIRVHEGPWQKVLPTLPAQAYDLLFYDPLNISPRPGLVGFAIVREVPSACSYIGEQQRFEKWGIPTCVFEGMQPAAQDPGCSRHAPGGPGYV